MRRLAEVLSRRLVSELCRRFPDRFQVIETHPCDGQYDCLSLVTGGPGLTGTLDVNRPGGVHLHAGPAGGGMTWSWSEWWGRRPGVR